MPTNKDIGAAALSDMENNVTDYSVSSIAPEAATGAKETEITDSTFYQNYGYFLDNSDLRAAVVGRSVWNFGKGWTADPEVTTILDHISGDGKDTFDEILMNLDMVSMIGGTAYAEIIWHDPELRDWPLNLKVLDPQTIKIILDPRGRIKRFEQMSKIPIGDRIKTFEPEDIFIFRNHRVADNVLGISAIDSKVILADGESFNDMKKIMHRQARPFFMFKLKTDDPVKIAAFIRKMDDATDKGENVYVPDDENTVTVEAVQMTISPIVLDWRNEVRKKFYRGIGLPELLPSGGGDSTESGGKIGYLAFEQTVEQRQRKWELAIWNQLHMRINLTPPATLSQDLQSDEQKDANQGLEFQPNDAQAGVGR